MNTTRMTQRKKKLPKALREQVWVQNIGHQFDHKCFISWCQNTMSAFDFHVGHDIPESKGGTTTLDNLKPICARCNLSMGNQYSIAEWSHIGKNTHTDTRAKVRANAPWWICC